MRQDGNLFIAVKEEKAITAKKNREICITYPASRISASMLSFGLLGACSELCVWFEAFVDLLFFDLLFALARPVLVFPIAWKSEKTRKYGLRVCVWIVREGNLDLEIISTTIFPRVSAHTRRWDLIGVSGKPLPGGVLCWLNLLRRISRLIFFLNLPSLSGYFACRNLS